MRTVSELLGASLHDVFSDRDADRRAAVIDEIYTEDVVFTDPDGVGRGRAHLASKVAELQSRFPADFEFTEDGPRYVGPGHGALAWAVGPNGSPVARGVDVITVTDGRISALTTLLAT
jgi:hypothetical protein